MDEVDDETLLQPLLDLAASTGSAIMKVRQSADLSIAHKADQSPVTAADMAAHQCLSEALPGLLQLPLVSEEGRWADFSERQTWRRYWLIDPLDGTREFLTGSDEFCINIALIQDHQPYLGLVHAPARNETYVGSRQLGAWKYQGEKRHAIQTRPLQSDRPLEVLTSRRHGKAAVETLLNRLSQRWSTSIEARPLGSALKICQLAEGRADLYPRLGPTSEWDTAAPHAILNAAHGALVTTEFRPLEYNREEKLINPDFYALGDSEGDWKTLFAE